MTQADDILQENMWFSGRILIGNKPVYMIPCRNKKHPKDSVMETPFCQKIQRKSIIYSVIFSFIMVLGQKYPTSGSKKIQTLQTLRVKKQYNWYQYC